MRSVWAINGSLWNRRFRKFEQALSTYDQGLIEEAKKEFKEFLEEMEEF